MPHVHALNDHSPSPLYCSKPLKTTALATALLGTATTLTLLQLGKIGKPVTIVATSSFTLLALAALRASTEQPEHSPPQTTPEPVLDLLDKADELLESYATADTDAKEAIETEVSNIVESLAGKDSPQEVFLPKPRTMWRLSSLFKRPLTPKLVENLLLKSRQLRRYNFGWVDPTEITEELAEVGLAHLNLQRAKLSSADDLLRDCLKNGDTASARFRLAQALLTDYPLRDEDSAYADALVAALQNAPRLERVYFVGSQTTKLSDILSRVKVPIVCRTSRILSEQVKSLVTKTAQPNEVVFIGTGSRRCVLFYPKTWNHFLVEHNYKVAVRFSSSPHAPWNPLDLPSDELTFKTVDALHEQIHLFEQSYWEIRFEKTGTSA